MNDYTSNKELSRLLKKVRNVKILLSHIIEEGLDTGRNVVIITTKMCMIVREAKHILTIISHLTNKSI